MTVIHSATSSLGAIQCNCIGNHRAFQLTDGYCICEPGYEYYDSNGVLRSDQDDTVSFKSSVCVHKSIEHVVIDTRLIANQWYIVGALLVKHVQYRGIV